MNAFITNANQDLIYAIQAVLKLYPTAKMEVTTTNSEVTHYISKEDEANLQEIYEKNKRGELEFCTKEEIIQSSNEILRKYGADV